MACDIEFLQLGLTPEQRALVDSQIKKFSEANKSLEKSLTKRAQLRESIDKMVMDKKQKEGVLRGERDDIEKAITQKRDEINKAEELEKDSISKHKEEVERLEEKAKKEQKKVLRIDEKDSRARIREQRKAVMAEAKTARETQRSKSNEEIGKIRDDISTLREIRKANTEATKELRAARSEVTNRITRAWFGDKRKSMNRANFEDIIESGKADISEFLDQWSKGGHNLFSAAEHNEDMLVEGVDIDSYKLADATNKDDPYTKHFIESMRERHNAQVAGAGMFDEHGITHADMHPAHIGKEIIMRKLFKSFRKSKNNEGIQEIRRDIINHIGEENFMEHIKKAYKDENIPTLDQALDDYHLAHATGKRVRLFSIPVQFKSYGDAVEFINKYSASDIIGNYAMNASSTARAMTKFNIGGKIRDEFIERNTKTPKEASKLKAYRDSLFDDGVSMSVHQYRISQVLKTVTSLEVLSRYIKLALSPMGDGARGEATMAFRYGSQNNVLHMAASIGEQFVRGASHPVKFAGRIIPAVTGGMDTEGMRGFVKLFGDMNNHIQERTGALVRPIGGKLSLTQRLGSYMENIDKGLVLEQSRRWADLLKSHSGKSLDDLPKIIGDDLRGNYKITDREWGEIQEKLKDQTTLSSTDFTGDLSLKVANMNYMNSMDATPGKVIIPSEALAKMRKENPNLHRFFSMFWTYAIKSMYGSYRTAMQYGGKGAIVNMIAHQGAGGMFGNTLYGYLAGGIAMNQWDPEEYFSDPKTYADAYLGAVGHLASTSFNSIFNPSMFLYSFNPNVSLAIKLGQLATDLSHDAFSDPDWDKTNKHLVYLTANFVPIGEFKSAKEAVVVYLND